MICYVLSLFIQNTSTAVLCCMRMCSCDMRVASNPHTYMWVRARPVPQDITKERGGEEDFVSRALYVTGGRRASDAAPPAFQRFSLRRIVRHRQQISEYSPVPYIASTPQLHKGFSL